MVPDVSIGPDIRRLIVYLDHHVDLRTRELGGKKPGTAVADRPRCRDG